MEVIRQDNILVKRFVNPFKTSNSFLVEIIGNDCDWIFDIGNSTEMLTHVANRRVKGLFLTHCHFDHIRGIKEFMAQHPDCFIYGSRKCIDWLKDDRRNLSFYYNQPLNFEPKKCIPLYDGDTIALADSVFVQAIETPGHNEDCISYKFENFIVSGDSYIPNVPAVTKLKGGDKQKYEVSRKHILELITDDSFILPGHGPLYRGRVILYD